MTGVSTGTVRPLAKRLGSAKTKKLIALTSMALPGAVWLLLLRYLPMFGIVIAFKEYRIYTKANTLLNNIIHSKWVGLKNFSFLFTTTDSLRMIRNTVCYNLVWIFLGMVVAVTFAVLLSQLPRQRIAKGYQTAMFFPYFLSWVVVSYFVFAFISPDKGLITAGQRAAGVVMPTNWYTVPGYWPGLLTVANLWKNAGYSSILYLATITGIDASLYEAARIDGATRPQQVRYITLPQLRSMILILLVMNLGRVFNSDFGLFYNVPMNSGPLFPVTQVIDTYVYRTYITTGNIGMSSAAGLFQQAVGFVFMMTMNMVAKRIDPNGGLF
ncbi:MAG: ABC transporter permease subunit [Oscillospiraceae bacterium]|jgi:putative aldouronate transport system permease protein|nr:ABC transporter permease subunit [Oscillospiraceae bacterium]